MTICNSINHGSTKDDKNTWITGNKPKCDCFDLSQKMEIVGTLLRREISETKEGMSERQNC
jgi:hypothetical protein